MPDNRIDLITTGAQWNNEHQRWDASVALQAQPQFDFTSDSLPPYWHIEGDMLFYSGGEYVVEAFPAFDERDHGFIDQGGIQQSTEEVLEIDEMPRYIHLSQGPDLVEISCLEDAEKLASAVMGLINRLNNDE